MALLGFSLAYSQKVQNPESQKVFSSCASRSILDAEQWKSLTIGGSDDLSAILHDGATDAPAIFYRVMEIQKPDFISCQVDQVYKEGYPYYGVGVWFYRDWVDMTITASIDAVPGEYVMKFVFTISDFPDMSQPVTDSLIVYLNVHPPLPSRPRLAFPDSNRADLPGDDTFIWKPVDFAEKYFFQLATDEAFTVPIISDSTRTDTSHTVSGLAEGRKYYWRVRAGNTAGVGEWSAIWNFSVLSPPPDPPVANAATAITTDGFTANWGAIAGADGYYLDVSPDEAFSSFVPGFEGKDVADVTAFGVTGLVSETNYCYRVRAYGAGGTSLNSNTVGVMPTGIDENSIRGPAQYALSQNYPNPFNPRTVIRFSLASAAFVTLTVYNSLGIEAARTVSRKMNAGTHAAEWDASGFESGIYYCKIHANDFSRTIKMLLIR